MPRDNRGGFGFREALSLAGLAALGLALAFSEFARRNDRDATAVAVEALRGEVAAARNESKAALAAIIAPETLSAAAASVYLIVVNGAPRGTAFVIDRDNGVLATAGHTADSLPLDDPKAEVHILNRATRQPVPVKSKKIHAGFGAFRTLVEAYQPTRKTSSIYAPQAAPVRDLAFDAGLITVEAVDPASGVNRLGPNLTVASEEKLLALAAGAAIAIIGYPYDTLDDGFAADAAISRVERGVVAAVMPPLDAATDEPDPRIANLIIHRFATAGGSSGSPVIDADGEVVGVHTHGIESISSNADGAAQRAEVLFDLLTPARDAGRVRDLFAPAWSRTLEHWARAKDSLPWSFYMEYARPGEDPAPAVGDFDFAAPAPFAKDIQDLEFGEGVKAYRVAAPDAPAAAASPSFLIRESGQFAEAWFKVDRAREAVLFAYDYSLRSRAGSCRLSAYWRRKGEARLQVKRPRASFELRLEAQAPQTEDFHVVFRRDADCDPTSRSFFAGSIAWTAPEGAVVAAAFEKAAAAERGPVARLAHTAGASVERILTCAFGTSRVEAECDAPRFVEIETD